MRKSEWGVWLAGPELEALVLGISGYELRRIPVQLFPPADRVVAGLGHLVRAHHEPQAWIVSAAFRMDLTPLTIKGATPTVEGIARIVELYVPTLTTTGDPAVGIPFRYRGLGGETFDDPEVDAMPGITHLAGAELEAVFAADRAAERAWPAHLVLSSAAWSTMIDRFARARVFVDAEPPTVEVYGLGYVLERDISRHHPLSPLETGLSLERETAPKRISAAAAELALRVGPPEIAAWTDRRLAEGWLVMRDFGAGGVVYDLCALSPDGEWAIGAHRIEGSWVRSPIVRLGSHSFEYAKRLVEGRVGAGAELA